MTYLPEKVWHLHILLSLGKSKRLFIATQSHVVKASNANQFIIIILLEILNFIYFPVCFLLMCIEVTDVCLVGFVLKLGVNSTNMKNWYAK